MIVVIADDLSGAAELAGIAFRYGLTAEVHLEFDPFSGAELVAVDTDSRSDLRLHDQSPVLRPIVRREPDWIYKKTDSVLRGRVADEVGIIASAFGRKECLLIPANPSKGRIIRDRTYFIDGVPLDETVFAEDPEFPAKTADVEKLLRKEGVRDVEIDIPDVGSLEELKGIAAGFDFGMLPAGGADFFEALLRRKLGDASRERHVNDPTLSDRIVKGARLLVCGSKAAWPLRRREFVSRSWPVIEFFRGHLPEEVGVETPELLGIAEREALLEDCPTGFAPQLARFLGRYSAERIRCYRDRISGVYTEGGATSVAVLNELEVKRLRVVGEAGPGAPYLEAIDSDLPLLCPKPGSYPWPEGVPG